MLAIIVFLLVVLGLVLRVKTPEERVQLFRSAIDYTRRTLRLGGILSREAIAYTPAGSEDFYDALRARTRWPIVTPALIAAYVVIHFLMLRSGGADEAALMQWGASSGPLTTNGEWWRLATAMFVHRGWLHLFIEAIGLAMAGVLIERLVGRAAMLLVYMSAGLLAGLWAMPSHPVSVSVGAAGGVYGVYGLIVATMIWGFIQRSPLTIPLAALHRIWPGAVIFVIYDMVTGGFLNEWMQGGLLAGVVGGLILAARVATVKPPLGRVCATTVATTALLFIFAAPLRGIANVTSEVARVIEVEERTAAMYNAEAERFKKGRLTAEELSTTADRIGVEIHATRTALATLKNIPPQHRQLLADTSEYLRLREESWRLRVEALRAGKMKTLHQASVVELQALAVFEKVEAVKVEKLKSEKVEK